MGSLTTSGLIEWYSGNPLTSAFLQPIDHTDAVVTDRTGTYALTLSVVQQGTDYALD